MVYQILMSTVGTKTNAVLLTAEIYVWDKDIYEIQTEPSAVYTV